MTYSIHYSSSTLNFIPYQIGDKMPWFLDFQKVLKSSIERGYIKKSSEIKTLVDGNDDVEAYFTSEHAWEDCKATLAAESEQKFSMDTFEYHL